MAVLPDIQHMKQIEDCCVKLLESGERLNAAEVASRLMALPDLPMHCPYHHFLVPAALLTAAQMCTGENSDLLRRRLKLAGERAGILPGGMCGQMGCCGAALGAGVFAAIWLDTTPMSRTGWAAVNAFTARCLAEVAAVEGPRCCKRVTWLTIRAAMPAAGELLGLKLGDFPKVKCTHFGKNRECRRRDCPFFPEPGRTET